MEQYKGYEIKVYWSSIDLGYVFCVFSKDGEGIMESFIMWSSLFRETVFHIHTLDSKRGMERTGRG